MNAVPADTSESGGQAEEAAAEGALRRFNSLRQADPDAALHAFSRLTALDEEEGAPLTVLAQWRARGERAHARLTEFSEEMVPIVSAAQAGELPLHLLRDAASNLEAAQQLSADHGLARIVTTHLSWFGASAYPGAAALERRIRAACPQLLLESERVLSAGLALVRDVHAAAQRVVSVAEAYTAIVPGASEYDRQVEALYDELRVLDEEACVIRWGVGFEVATALAPAVRRLGEVTKRWRRVLTLPARFVPQLEPMLLLSKSQRLSASLDSPAVVPVETSGVALTNLYDFGVDVRTNPAAAATRFRTIFYGPHGVAGQAASLTLQSSIKRVAAAERHIVKLGVFLADQSVQQDSLSVGYDSDRAAAACAALQPVWDHYSGLRLLLHWYIAWFSTTHATEAEREAVVVVNMPPGLAHRVGAATMFAQLRQKLYACAETYQAVAEAGFKPAQVPRLFVVVSRVARLSFSSRTCTWPHLLKSERQVAICLNAHVHKWAAMTGMPHFGDVAHAATFATALAARHAQAAANDTLVSAEVAARLSADFEARCRELPPELCRKRKFDGRHPQLCTASSTCVLLIDCHGVMMTAARGAGRGSTPEQIVKLVQVPRGLVYTRIALVPPGVVNYVEGAEQPEFVANLVRLVQSMIRVRYDVSRFVGAVVAELERGVDYAAAANQWYADEYFASRMRPQCTMYLPGEACVQKEFVADSEEDHKARGGGYRDGIHVLNEPGVPDLLGTALSLTTLFAAAQQRGYSHLIVIDMSCNSFDSDDVTQEQKRLLAHHGLAGGRRHP